MRVLSAEANGEVRQGDPPGSLGPVGLLLHPDVTDPTSLETLLETDPSTRAAGPSRIVDLAADGEAVFAAPSSDALLVVGPELADQPELAYELLMAVCRGAAEVAVLDRGEGAGHLAVAARRSVWANLDGSFLGTRRLLAEGAWTKGVRYVHEPGSDTVRREQLYPAAVRDDGVGDSPSPRWWARTGVLAVVMIVVELALQLIQRRPPFVDEEIYFVMGQRTLLGFLHDDRWLSWVTGSALYPALVGASVTAGGLLAGRLLSAAFIAAAAMLASRAVADLGQPELRVPTAAAVLFVGPLLYLGHQANHDVGVLLGLGLALFFIGRYHEAGFRRYLVWAGLSCILVGLSAYAGLFMLAPVLLLVLTVCGNRRRDAAVFSLAAGGPILLYAFVYRHDLVALRDLLNAISPTLRSSPPRVLAELAWYYLPALLLALVGFRASRLPRGMRRVMLLGFALLPVFHSVTSTDQAAVRHAAYGVVFASPLLGAGLHRLVSNAQGVRSSVRTALVATVLVPVGLGQAVLLDRAWLDIDPVIEYLAREMEPGDRIYSEAQWEIAGRLYRDHLIGDPWPVYNRGRIALEGGRPDPCDLDWYVHTPDEHEAPIATQEIQACGTFQQVFVHRADATLLQPNYRFRTQHQEVSVWRNTNRGRIEATS